MDTRISTKRSCQRHRRFPDDEEPDGRLPYLPHLGLPFGVDDPLRFRRKHLDSTADGSSGLSNGPTNLDAASNGHIEHVRSSTSRRSFHGKEAEPLLLAFCASKVYFTNGDLQVESQ